MKHKAGRLGVDLLLVDTGINVTPRYQMRLSSCCGISADGIRAGDLHDGAGLSDATTPNGRLSNPIFENIDYDLLTIGALAEFRLIIIF